MSDSGKTTRKRLQNKAGPTLQDVAARAAVSTASVSRYLNTPQSVGAARRQRIEAAIAELGYVPHGAARALASRRSQTVGAVIPTLDNAIFARGIQAFQQRLTRSGYTLLLASSNYDVDEEARQAETLIKRGVDAMFLVGRCHAPALYQRLERLGKPYVNCWSYSREATHPCVGFDNRRAARRIASYLLEIGHRHIAMIAGITRHNDRAGERLAGVRAALGDYGLDLRPDWLIEAPYEIAEGRKAMRTLLGSGPRPTAVICGNDVLAHGALFECAAENVPVPEAISITGFDDLPLSAHIRPGLTTMQVPSEEMGAQAAEYLLNRLDGHPTPPAVELEVDLLVRGTSAPPPA